MWEDDDNIWDKNVSELVRLISGCPHSAITVNLRTAFEKLEDKIVH